VLTVGHCVTKTLGTGYKYG